MKQQAVSPVNNQPRPRLTRPQKKQRIERIIEMHKQRMTLDEMGTELHITRERARQLIKEIAQAQGKHVFTPRERTWSAPEAAAKLKVNYGVVLRCCQKGTIPCRLRGKKHYLLDQQSIVALRAYLRNSKKRICVVCGQTFSTTINSKKIICSKKCTQQRKKQRKAAYRQQKPVPDDLRRWQKNLFQQLQEHSMPATEEWLTITEAARYSGLNLQALVWLRYRNIVTVRHHPTKTWRGQPIALYAKSEMEIARKVFAAYQDHSDPSQH